MKYTSTFLLIGLVTCPKVSAATMIGLNLTGNASGAAGAVMATDDLSGAPGVRQDNWNNVGLNTTDTVSTAVYEDGTAVGGSFTVHFSNLDSGGAGTRNGTANTDETQFYSGVYDEYSNDLNSPTTLEVRNIPFAVYDVYVYMRDDGADRAGVFQIGSTTYYARGGAGNPSDAGTGYVLSSDTDPGAADGDIDQGNYVVFRNLTGADFDLITAAYNTSAAADRNKWTGLQIVQVPEVGSSALLVISGLLISLRRRRYGH
ncbi:MAG: hypothetical protein ACQKBY_01705 [Verrucomicrobiales bacterium]